MKKLNSAGSRDFIRAAALKRQMDKANVENKKDDFIISIPAEYQIESEGELEFLDADSNDNSEVNNDDKDNVENQ